MNNKEKQRKIQDFRDRLLKWGDENIEDYPWRYRKDTYGILVAELMLHRTQKLQAETVYLDFIKHYPTLDEFIEVDTAEIKNILAPLGLNWRIEGIIEILNSLNNQYGQVPHEKEKLIKERNIGPYIAGATATFATNLPHPLIDTNTVRVIGRVFGLNLEGEARRRKDVMGTIEEVCDLNNPRDYYYAMIDLAHKICLPKDPLCTDCPLFDSLCHFGNNLQ